MSVLGVHRGVTLSILRDLLRFTVIDSGDAIAIKWLDLQR